MITYNSKVDLQSIKEKEILLAISKSEKELLRYISKEDIKNISNNDVDLCTFDIEKMLFNISICEFLWYNSIYKKYKEYRSSLHKTYTYTNISTNKVEQEQHYNTFLSAMASAIKKYGKELLEA